MVLRWSGNPKTRCWLRCHYVVIHVPLFSPLGDYFIQSLFHFRCYLGAGGDIATLSIGCSQMHTLCTFGIEPYAFGLVGQKHKPVHCSALVAVKPPVQWSLPEHGLQWWLHVTHCRVVVCFNGFHGSHEIREIKAGGVQTPPEDAGPQMLEQDVDDWGRWSAVLPVQQSVPPIQ